jgi:hypothetical protein
MGQVMGWFTRESDFMEFNYLQPASRVNALEAS